MLHAMLHVKIHTYKADKFTEERFCVDSAVRGFKTYKELREVAGA